MFKRVHFGQRIPNQALTFEETDQNESTSTLPINQSINRSIGQSLGQSIRPSINQSINQSKQLHAWSKVRCMMNPLLSGTFKQRLFPRNVPVIVEFALPASSSFPNQKEKAQTQAINGQKDPSAIVTSRQLNVFGHV
jgi:hypothetical protein